MKALGFVFRLALGIMVGLVQALVLALLLGWMLKSEGAFALLLLLGWPLLTWRNLRKPRASPERPPLLRRSVLPLLALPIVASFPAAAFISSLTGHGGSVLGLLLLAFMACLYIGCWGAAFMALLAHLGTRKKAS